MLPLNEGALPFGGVMFPLDEGVLPSDGNMPPLGGVGVPFCVALFPCGPLTGGVESLPLRFHAEFPFAPNPGCMLL